MSRAEWNMKKMAMIIYARCCVSEHVSKMSFFLTRGDFSLQHFFCCWLRRSYLLEYIRNVECHMKWHLDLLLAAVIRDLQLNESSDMMDQSFSHFAAIFWSWEKISAEKHEMFTGECYGNISKHLIRIDRSKQLNKQNTETSLTVVGIILVVFCVKDS